MLRKPHFRYLPIAPGAETWGLVVTGAGHFDTPAHSAYPPDRHPDDHMFDWEHGRILPAFQIFYIHRGGGELESRVQPPQKIVAGSAFMLAPGLWHRFRPDSATGWTESWVEFSGPIPDALYAAGQLGAALVNFADASRTGLPAALDATFQQIQQELPGINPTLTAFGMELLAAWNLLWEPKPKSTRLEEALTSAVRIIEEEYRTPLDLEALAGRVGMSYSLFRKEFQNHTGFGPWKYVQRLRLIRARHSLATSKVTLEELAKRLGFSSAFHLSAAFSKEFGISPSQWKRG